MMKNIMKNKILMKKINSTMTKMPTPSSISLWWNFGSLLGMCLFMQILTGLFLAMHYNSSTEIAFNSIIHIYRNVNNGWIMKNFHANGASLMFMIMYIHISRGIYYSLFKNTKTWTIGVIILFITMMTAFMGYVLPWGQMSFWGATVITNLISAIPYLGNDMVKWIWGSYSVDKPTLNRFFTMHFIMPFLIMMMSMIHLMFLHQKGSNNPTGMNSNIDKIPFQPYFSIKDIMGMMGTLYAFFLMNMMEPQMMMDPENFMQANPMITPNHIQPEWYFLFAYTILRSIPNKLGGVMAMIMSIMILIILPTMNKNKIKSNMFYPMSKIMFWSFITITIMLTWMGSQPAEEPFIKKSQMITFFYFSYFIINPMTMKMWDNINK